VTFFVDANVLVYSWVEGPYREPCLEILTAIAEGATDGRTSTAALEEVWYAELSGRAGDLTGLTGHAYTIMTPLLSVTDEAFRRALSLSAPPEIGSNDRLHAGTCLSHGIEVVVSADRDFDRLRGVRRVEPRDDRARRRLLSAHRP
jgi:predicted nucleic acid-binding protein